MAKKKEVLQPVEASIQTKKRAKTPAYIFIIYNRETNETIFESEKYTARNNARRGARRYAARNKYAISRWVK